MLTAKVYKKCCSCKELLLLELFGKSKNQFLGHAKVCKACRSAAYKQNPEKQKLQASLWKKNNPEKRLLNNRRWREENPEKAKESANNWRRRNTDYGAFQRAQYRAAQNQATPKWANDFYIKEIYNLAKQRSETTGFKWHVDHVVPLNSKIVCGLHVESNMQVIPGLENIQKSNKWSC